ncbi:lipopolysaccharide transport periplasmic protein LptA [Chitinimonas sp.]|uniref:lipopolysaccharide transport periplasmic protein LptA n=1 Tax=Chitinimonas sp. TaxID=1934313 RepID=UPI0035AE7E4F
MSRQNANPYLAAILLAALALHSHAELADRSLPMHISAKSAEADDKAGVRRLIDDVRITQGTMVFTADLATVLETRSGQKVTGEGRPVKFRQKMEASADWLDAVADRLEYDSQTGDVRLLGHAWLKKGADELVGNLITYNTNTEKYRAEGGKGVGVAGSTPADDGRVHMVIQPKQKPADGKAK